MLGLMPEFNKGLTVTRHLEFMNNPSKIASAIPVFSGVIAGLLTCLGVSFGGLAAAQNADDSGSTQKVLRISKDIPPVTGLYQVAGHDTPTGFPVPRYVSLKSSKAYGRSGPSRDHAVSWEYHRKGLPMIVVAETELWRKVRDYRGDESWMHSSLLSGRRRVLVLEEAPLRKKSREASPALALAPIGSILDLDECTDGFCRVVSREGLKGWIRRSSIWGANALR